MAVESMRELDPQYRPSNRTILLFLSVFAAALVFYAVFWPTAPAQAPDSNTYMSFAREIAQGRVAHLQMRTPGYPLFLLLTRSEVTPQRLLFYTQLALHFASISFLAYVLWFLRVKAWAIAAFTGVALLPPYVEPSAYVLSETLTTFCVVADFAALIFWLHTRKTALLALFTAAAVSAPFVRPTYELLVPLTGSCAAVAMLLGCLPRLNFRRLILPMALSLALAMGCLGAYSFWNYKRFHYFGTSYLSALALSIKTVTVIEFLPPEYAGLKEILLRHRDKYMLQPGTDHMALDYIHRAYPDVLQYYGGDEVKALNELRRMNAALIEAKPMSYLIESSKLFWLYWLPDERPLSAGQSGIRRAMGAALQMAVIGIFFLQEIMLCGVTIFWLSLRLFGKGAAWSPPEGAGLACAAWLIGSGIIFYNCVVACAFGSGIPRYRSTSDLLIMAVSAVGYTLWMRAVRRIGAGRSDSLRDSEAALPC